MRFEAVLNVLSQKISSQEYQAVFDLIDNLTKSGCNESAFHELCSRAFYATGNIEEALSALEKALKIDPEKIHVWLTYGQLLLEKNYALEAECVYRKIKASGGLKEDALLGLAAALSKQNKSQESIQVLRKILAINPQRIDAWFNLAQELSLADNWEESVRIAKRAHYLSPSDLDIILLLSNGLIKLNRAHEARALWEQIPQHEKLPPEFHGNLAEIYKLCGEHSRAVNHLIKACDAHPSSLPLKYNLCLCYEAIGEYEKAIQLAKALVSQHDSPQFASLLAQLLLVTGDFKSGWKYYEKRQTNVDFKQELPNSDVSNRALNIEFLRSKPVVLVREQGIGDTLFFLRYAKLLRESDVKIFLDIGPKLSKLIQNSPEIEDIPLWGSPQCYTSNVIPLLVGSLPYIFGEIIPEPLRFDLRSEEAKSILAKTKLDCDQPTIGVTWQAGLVPKTSYRERGNLQKRVEPAWLGEALNNTKGTVVLLQREPTDEDLRAFMKNYKGQILDYCNFNHDLELMLGLLSQLDNYVGVSNTNIHLRAGLGLPADILICNPPEWRWMSDGQASPWFPEFKLFRPRLDGHLYWPN